MDGVSVSPNRGPEIGRRIATTFGLWNEQAHEVPDALPAPLGLGRASSFRGHAGDRVRRGCPFPRGNNPGAGILARLVSNPSPRVRDIRVAMNAAPFSRRTNAAGRLELERATELTPSKLFTKSQFVRAHGRAATSTMAVGSASAALSGARLAIRPNACPS